MERQRILSQFQGLRLSLEEHSRHLLARLGDLERDMGKVQEENVTSLTKEISRLDVSIQELEEKCRQPARTFLQVTRDGATGSGGVWSNPVPWDHGREGSVVVSGGPFNPNRSVARPRPAPDPNPMPQQFSRWLDSMGLENLFQCKCPRDSE